MVVVQGYKITDLIVLQRGGTQMNKTDKKDDKSSWIIGGTTCIGIGVGFIFLHISALLFIACIMIGVGTGLVAASIFSSKKD